MGGLRFFFGGGGLLFVGWYFYFLRDINVRIYIYEIYRKKFTRKTSNSDFGLESKNTQACNVVITI